MQEKLCRLPRSALKNMKTGAKPLRVREMRHSDLPFADSLRALAGWNQTLAEWRRFLSMQPKGCFLAEWNGAAAGTATTASYGSDLAWIGMVLVHPEYRRCGIGRSLLLRCIEHLRASGIRCIKLDATPEGRPIYESLGFKAEWTLRRWEGDFFDLTAKAHNPLIRAWEDSDLPRFNVVDSHAFGTSRSELIRDLARQSCCALSYAARQDDLLGCGFLRPRAGALYLGPLSAASPEAGLALAEALTNHCQGRVLWDIPDSNDSAVDWARRHGFRVQRSLTRMWLGDNSKAGNALEQFALAGPELG
jgi:ribosomal protein S18 acetylase RimI-like enzyme